MRPRSQGPHAKANAYRPRNAAGSPLYRLLQDHLEEFLAQGGLRPGKSPTHPGVVERSLRAFLECGIPRFGVVRFRCPKCSENLFVAFCLNCGGRLEPVAAILADKQLVRLLAYLELPTDFPTLAPARGRAQTFAEESQVGPDPPLSDSIDWAPLDDVQAPGADWLGA